MNNEIKNTPPENHIITDADRAVCLGSGEILNCPHCGRYAISVGKQGNKHPVYSVICTGLHKCGAAIHVCQETAEEARKDAIAQWNARAATASDAKLAEVCELLARFLIAHRDTHRNWIEHFAEIGAIKVDFNYHPLYPFIEPAHKTQK